MVSCLATRQLDWREIQTQWLRYSGIALTGALSMVFYEIYRVSHKAHHATHNTEWLSHGRPDTQLNLVKGYFPHIHTHALKDAHSSRVTSMLACGMAKA